MTFDRKAYMKAYLKKWRAANREKIHQYSLTNCGRWARPNRQWRKLRTPEAIAARDALNNAVRLKKVVKLNLCEVCFKPGRMHGHHKDYSKPLKVLWICPDCHGKLHQKENANVI